MCEITWLEHTRCQHSEKVVREGGRCAIGHGNPDDRFHWKEAQGGIYADDLCRPCQARLERYGTADPGVSWTRLNEAVSRAKAKYSRSNDSSNGSVSDASSK